jgi:hypothetical protein
MAHQQPFAGQQIPVFGQASQLKQTGPFTQSPVNTGSLSQQVESSQSQVSTTSAQQQNLIAPQQVQPQVWQQPSQQQPNNSLTREAHLAEALRDFYRQRAQHDKVSQVDSLIVQYGHADIKASLWHKYKALPTGWESVPNGQTLSGSGNSGGGGGGSGGGGGGIGDWTLGFGSVVSDLSKTIKEAVVGEEIDTVSEC